MVTDCTDYVVLCIRNVAADGLLLQLICLIDSADPSNWFCPEEALWGIIGRDHLISAGHCGLAAGLIDSGLIGWSCGCRKLEGGEQPIISFSRPAFAARGIISGVYKFYSKAASTMEFFDTFSLCHLHIVDSLTSVSNLVTLQKFEMSSMSRLLFFSEDVVFKTKPLMCSK